VATSFGSAAGAAGDGAGAGGGVGEGVWAFVVIVEAVAVVSKRTSPNQILNEAETVFIYLLRAVKD
jgi:glycerate kinase